MGEEWRGRSLNLALYILCACVVVEQKWSKGKVREKVANKVLFDQDGYQRLVAEIPKVCDYQTDCRW